MNEAATRIARLAPALNAPHQGAKFDGRRRAVIARIRPEIDAGRFPIKRTLGDVIDVEAEIFADGHDSLSAVLLHRLESSATWTESPMESAGNDLWRGSFSVSKLGVYHYTALAWVDHFKSWQHHLAKKVEAQQDVASDLLTGAQWVAEAAARPTSAPGPTQLAVWADILAGRADVPVSARVELALSPQLSSLMALHGDRSHATMREPELRVVVEPVLARFGAWYELFPRSLGPGAHGTFRDVVEHLPRIAAMGFDVLYLPPIHPIGRSFRKGKNNNPTSQPDEPGSPWGIGSAEGGHKSIHPQLGTLADFRHLVEKARARKIEIALDIAFQCSPDHPYVKEHPEWFRHRPDGSIQYAENPPKKYQDIYPFDFETEHWESLWSELRSIFEYWIEQGVSVFRVDNPHTKPFEFWEWCLGDLKGRHPHLVFLSEAFTRPKVMQRLAKLGFTQSYNYFPWRNTKQELTDYFTELTQTDVREYLRPNLWPNTPDILTQYLQTGGRPAFMVRLILAATLGASYGIYGPTFELCVHQAREEGSEEYLDSEKYEIKRWDLESPGHLGELIQRVNRIRRAHPALQWNEGLRFHPVDNEYLLAYSKASKDGDEHLLIVVNLDPRHVQRGWLDLSGGLDIPQKGSYQVHDLLTDARYLWNGGRNFVELDPQFSPAHIFRLRQRVRTERDFDYYL
jgi:starch synthase (maltosyl-transferring)